MLASNFYHCGTCGRSRFGDERLSGTVVALIIVVSVIALVVMGIVGNNGAYYR
jgi:hypothetical protein